MPAGGVAPDAEGNLLSELDDGSNPVAACDIAPSQVDRSFVDGGAQASAPHLTTSYACDSYGRATASTETSSDGAGGSPTTIVRRASYAWNDGVTATSTSATGTYLVDFPAFGDVEEVGEDFRS